MAKAFTTWTVLPHGPIEKIADNLWRVEGTMPDGKTRRVMTLVRLADGRVLIHNAIALEDDLMAEICAWGAPTAILVPNRFHRQDARIMKDRFPSARVFCPEGARKGVAQVVAVDGTYPEVPQDGTVKVRHLEGMKAREGIVEVTSADGKTLVFCDTLLNVKKVSPVIAFFLAPVGRPSVPRFARWFWADNSAALREDLDRLASIDGLKRLIPGHGAPILEGASHALKSAAQLV